MRLILAILLSICLPSSSQTITGGEVDASGYFIRLWVTGLNTNGTHDLGFNTNRIITGNEKLRLDFISQEPLTPSTVSRREYGTEALRIPGTSLKDETPFSGGIILKYGLSMGVTVGDSNLVLSTSSGLYSQGGSNLAAVSSMTITNSSVQKYTKTIGNWTRPSFLHIQSNTVTQYARAYHESAGEGRPVQAILFTATDGTNTAQAWSYKPKVDLSYGNAKPVPEYVGVLDLSSFPQPNFIKFDFMAFPWWGDTNAVLDTAKTGFTFPHPAPTSVTNLVDSAGAYQIVRAVVATNGVNATGVAANPTYWSTNQNPSPFLNIGAALQAIAATNNAQHGHNDLTAGVVLLNEGNHTWLGSSCTITAGPRIWTVLEPVSGADPDNVVISAQGTDTRCTNDRDLFLFRRITFNTSGALFVQANVWMDNCPLINLTSSSVNQSTSGQLVWYITRSTVSNITQGIRSFSTQRLGPWFIGNTIVGTIPTIHALNMAGNLKTVGASDQVRILSGVTGGLTPKFGQLIDHNEFFNLRYLGNIIDIGADSNIVEGFVLVNNLFEQTTNNTASTAFNIASTEGRYATNLIVWNNTLEGTKSFFLYDDSGTNFNPRWQCSVYGNLFVDLNAKGDLFSPTNANRVGNWPFLFGSGSFGNAWLETDNIGADGAFLPDFTGLSSWAGDGTGSTNYAAYWNRQSHDGVGTLPGGGDYRLLTRSPLHTRSEGGRKPRQKWVTSHDLNGLARGVDDPPGAYVEGVARKGWFE
jgi:hypothetical protein